MPYAYPTFYRAIEDALAKLAGPELTGTELTGAGAS
jgi:hypothetical protein